MLDTPWRETRQGGSCPLRVCSFSVGSKQREGRDFVWRISTAVVQTLLECGKKRPRAARSRDFDLGE